MSHRTIVIADHHKSVFVCQILDRKTGEARRSTLQSRRDQLRPFLAGLPGPVLVFVEACRSWEWVSDLCTDLGLEFRLVNPRHMPEIAKSVKKTDRADVNAMVTRFLVDKLPESRVASRAEREFRALTRELTSLRFDHRVMLQKIHALVDAQGMPATKKQFATDAWREQVREELSGDTWFLLNRLLERWDANREERERFEQRIKALGQNLSNVALLQTIPGVGPVIAATIVAEVPNISEFKSARHFAAFTGLVPRVRSSAGKPRIGSITKAGPPALRWALTQSIFASQTSKDPTEPFLQYRRKRKKGKAPKVALCAAAHKLARIVWAMLTHQTEYRTTATA